MITGLFSQQQAVIYATSLEKFKDSGLIEQIEKILPPGATQQEYEAFGEAIACIIEILKEEPQSHDQLFTKLVMMASLAFTRAQEHQNLSSSR